MFLNCFKVFWSCLSFSIWFEIAFTCYYENFLHITTNFVNFPLQNIPMYMYRNRHSKSWRSQTKKNWKCQSVKIIFDVILDRENFTYLENKKYLILVVDRRKSNVFNYLAKTMHHVEVSGNLLVLYQPIWSWYSTY